LTFYLGNALSASALTSYLELYLTVSLETSPIGLGTGRLASIGNGISKKAATTLIHTAIDHGIRLIDTADTYGSGDSERTIGNALRGRVRKDCFLITKAGFRYVTLPAMLSPLNQIGKKLLQAGPQKKDFSRSYLLRCLEASLRRLRTDYVDAFVLHAVEAGEATDESWEALEIIRGRGLSRMTGISTSDPKVVRRGLATGQVQLVETPVCALAEGLDEIVNLCAASGVEIVGNEVLKPRRLILERTAEWDSMCDRNELKDVSRIHLLIAYALAQPAVASVVIGSLSPGHMVENLEAVSYRHHKDMFKEMKEFLK
jgi:pyridoxine 4-dehydrogenase